MNKKRKKENRRVMGGNKEKEEQKQKVSIGCSVAKLGHPLSHSFCSLFSFYFFSCYLLSACYLGPNLFAYCCFLFIVSSLLSEKRVRNEK